MFQIVEYHYALCRHPEPGRFEVTGGPPWLYLCLDLSTHHASQPEAAGDRIELKNLAKEALRQLEMANADKRRVAALMEHLDDLVDDDEFWRFQARSLAVLATPENARTFRVPNALVTIVEVSDHFTSSRCYAPSHFPIPASC